MNEDMTLEETVGCLKEALGMSDMSERNEYDFDISVSPDKFYLLQVERVTVPGHYIIKKRLALDRFARVLDDDERKRYLADCHKNNWNVNLADYGQPFHYRYIRYYVRDDGKMYVKKEDK